MIRTMGNVLAATLLVIGACGGTASEPNSDPVDAPDAAGVEPGNATTTSLEGELVPLGASAHVGDGWHLTIDAVDSDAASDSRQLGEPPAPTESFVLLDITLGYQGQDQAGSPPGLIAMELVAADGSSYDEWCNISMERQLNYQTLVTAGESISGQVCFRFPTAQLDSMVLAAGTSERTQKAFAMRTSDSG